MLDEKEYKDLKENISFHHFDSTTESVTLGAFKISAFNVNHSVPESLGLAITTPEGIILHIADFKIDFSPVIDKPIDLAKIALYGERGVFVWHLIVWVLDRKVLFLQKALLMLPFQNYLMNYKAYKFL